MIHIYTGDGKGKTTAAIGLAVRMAGYRKRVLFVQFLKGSATGELRILKKSQHITVLRCDRDYGFYDSMSETDKENISKCHIENLTYILSHMNEFDMIVMDEIFAALSYGIADLEAVKRIVRTYSGELVLTGRNADEWFVKKADYVTEMKKCKHPYENGVAAREGIEY